MADRKGRRLPSVTAEYLAQHVTDNLRELEGALNCLINIARLHQSPLTLEMAKAALDEFLDLGQRSPAGGVSSESIIDIVLDHYEMDAADLLSARKVRTIVRARQVGMYLARQLTPLSLTQIGSLFGGRDHTTVLYALRQIEKNLSSDQRLRSEVETIRSRLSIAHLR
jgi:chromosomal replication initiator protein